MGSSLSRSAGVCFSVPIRARELRHVLVRHSNSARLRKLACSFGLCSITGVKQLFHVDYFQTETLADLMKGRQRQISRSAVKEILQYREPQHCEVKMLAVMDRRR